MRLPLQITFRHVDPSPSVEDRIREYAGELDRFFDQIIPAALPSSDNTGATIKAICSGSDSTSRFPAAKSWSDAIRSRGAPTTISQSPFTTRSLPPAARSRITHVFIGVKSNCIVYPITVG